MVKGVGRDYGNLSRLDGDLPIADQNARSALDDLETLLLVGMDVTVSRSKGVHRVTLWIAYRIHRQDLLVGPENDHALARNLHNLPDERHAGASPSMNGVGKNER
jgi:hypothetical protein